MQICVPCPSVLRFYHPSTLHPHIHSQFKTLTIHSKSTPPPPLVSPKWNVTSHHVTYLPLSSAGSCLGLVWVLKRQSINNKNNRAPVAATLPRAQILQFSTSPIRHAAPREAIVRLPATRCPLPAPRDLPSDRPGRHSRLGRELAASLSSVSQLPFPRHTMPRPHVLHPTLRPLLDTRSIT